MTLERDIRRLCYVITIPREEIKAAREYIQKYEEDHKEVNE